VADHNGDGRLEAVFTTRFDGTIWVVDDTGDLIGQYARPFWLEGGIAAAVQPGSSKALFAYQESAGKMNLSDYAERVNLSVQAPGEGRIGTMPVLADVDGDPALEVVCARRDGRITVFSEDMLPLWQFDTGSPFDASPAVAPILEFQSIIYAQNQAGTVHAVAGDGVLLWRYQTENSGVTFPSNADPLVTQLDGSPTVLVSDVAGWLYALDAYTGHEYWRVQAGATPLGTPALFDAHPSAGREIIVVDEKGAITVLSAGGQVLQQARLPQGGYVARPLVADIDADDAPELLVAARDWHFLVATLDGTVKEKVETVGAAKEGLVLADLTQNGYLELLVATECGRVLCYPTTATDGWNHPRGDASLAGFVPPMARSHHDSPKPRSARGIRIRRATLGHFTKEAPFSTAVLEFARPRAATHALAIIQQDERIIGSAVRALAENPFTVPLVRTHSGDMTARVQLFDAEGSVVAVSKPRPIAPSDSDPTELPSIEAFTEALAQHGAAFEVSPDWALPKVGDRDSWHVIRYMPEQWKTFGLAETPFIRDAIRRVASSANKAESAFGPDHPAWANITADTKPFFVLNDYFRPQKRYPDEALQRIRAMGGDRFLGFPVHEWGYHIWKTLLEWPEEKPADKQAAFDILREDFGTVLDLCDGAMYQGQGYCLFHHQAFAWGAGMGYAEIGENIQNAPLQFAFLRGAARQYGGRPWGAYLSNWFRGAIVDTRVEKDEAPLRWSPPNIATGPDVGHSPSLELRMEMAAHMAGATFVHHESDGHNGSIFMQRDAKGTHSLSPFGESMDAWHSHSRRYPDRGVPYTPIAFQVDFNHGWQPRADIYGIWPLQRHDLALERMFEHVFPYGGRLDFERGYMANGPYGDTVDVLTNDATTDTLSNYGVLWPLGDIALDEAYAARLEAYVRQGGILVADAALAAHLDSTWIGVTLRKQFAHATDVQTALGIPQAGAPYRYHPMHLTRGAQAIAWTEEGEPILTWRRVGQGVVIVGATNHWLDADNQLSTLAPLVLENIAQAFLPVQPTADVEYLLTRTHQGYVVTLINNAGVSKVPTLSAEFDADETRDCILKFRDKGPRRFVSRWGDFRWNNSGNGLRTRIAPGELAIVELIW
jgi:hypothetical protein